MFCPTCGIEIPDESRFCTGCGAVLSTESASTAPETTTEAPASEGFSIGSLKLPFSPKKLVAIVAAAAVLIAAVFGVAALFSAGSEDPTYVYLSDGSYMLLTDLNKDAREVASAKSEEDYYGRAFFSEDGKYLYYFTKIEDIYGSGTLNRIPVSKIGKDAAKNEKHVETVDSDVSASSIELVGKNAVSYRNSKGTLYYYNGKEPVQIAKDVNDTYVCGDKHLLYTVREEDAEYPELWGVALNKLDDPVRLGKDVSTVTLYNDPKNILFLKDASEKDDDGYSNYKRDLYKVAFGKEAEKIGENVSSLYWGPEEDDDTYYFLAETGETVKMYDYVNDDDKDSYASEYLQDKDNEDYTTITLYNVHCHKKGKVTTVLENVLDYRSYNGAMIFKTLDMLPEDKPDLSDFEDVWDLRTLFAVNFEEENSLYLFESGKTVKMSSDAADTLAESLEEESATYLYACGNYVYMDGAENELHAAEIKNGAVGSFDLIGEDVEVCRMKDGTLYYLKDIHERDDYEYGDLISVKNGKETTLARDICSDWGTVVYEDGMILAVTDKSDKGEEYTLFNKKGEGTVVGEEISYIYRMNDKNILYISDDDLYSFKKNKSNRIATDVEYLWVFGEMEEYIYF